MKPIQTEREFKWQRLQTIMEAIQSYREENKNPNSEWITEKINLEKELGLREERNVPVKVQKFVWTDELVKEFVAIYSTVLPSGDLSKYLDAQIAVWKMNNPKAPIKVDAGKEWEIISVTYFGGYPSDAKEGNKVKWSKDNYAQWWDLDELLKSDSTKIHSVKRLSDSSVWTVGEMAMSGKEQFTIEGFTISSSGEFMDVIGQHFSYNISEISKLPSTTTQQTQEQKPVLFVTEDGIEIRKGNTFWIVDTDWSVYQPLPAHEESGKQIERKYFSTERAAGEYVIKNRPYLSLEEIMIIVRTIKDGAKGHYAKMYLNQKLHDLVKSKRQSLPETKPMSESKETARIEMFTKEEMDKAITDAFNEARERNGQNEVALQIKPFMKYQDAADYLKSISNQK